MNTLYFQEVVVFVILQFKFPFPNTSIGLVGESNLAAIYTSLILFMLNHSFNSLRQLEEASTGTRHEREETKGII